MPRSSMRCLIRGELRKIALQRTNWVLPAAAIGLGIVAANAAADAAPQLGPIELALDTYRVFAAAAIGVMMLGIAAQLVAAEYHWGTIRVVTGRGVGRLRLLGAKLVATGIVALPLLALLGVGGVGDLAVRLTQQTTPIPSSDIWFSTVVVVLSAAVCAVLGAVAAAVGRSMTFAMAAVAAFFPTDNILGYVVPLIQNATQEQTWSNATTFLLGPTLNQLPAVLMGRPAAQLVGPESTTDLTHSLVVIGGYVGALLTLAALVTSQRDITG